MIGRPLAEEYAGYNKAYVELVPDCNISDYLGKQLDEMTAFLSEIPEALGDYSYAPGKWTLKEVIGHISDNERIMSYRLLAIARGEQQVLPGYDQDPYMATVDYSGNTLGQLIEDFTLARRSSLSMIGLLSDEALLRTGTSNGKVSAQALAYILAGHAQHHWNGIAGNYLK
ncbi:DinB family protein [Paenibacillus sp. NPDC058174]|uniref:DinB family protein n=1 Tax=Paenibacillus sp. NPDC058174 TaxID=3346366 RepID=UPI0036DC3858